MAWAKTLLECSFRNVKFDVVSTRDAYSRATSVAEYPYLDGGEVEDLGARPVRFSLQAIWFGDDYEERLRDALQAFDTPGVGELIHPVWGSVEKAQLVSYDISHTAEEPDCATVSLEFIESNNDTVFWARTGAAQVQENVGAPGDQAVAESESAVVEVVDAVHLANPLQALDDLRQAMLGPVLGFVAEVQGVVTSALDVLNYPRAWARDIASLSNGLLSIANFPNRLMSEWRAITGVFQRIGDQWGGDSSSFGYSPWQRGSTPTQAQAQAVVRAHISVNNATAQADAAAIVLASEAIAPTLSPTEIETVTGSTRAVIEATIAIVRLALPLEQARLITEPLKDQALAIQSSAQAIIEARPPLVRRTLSAPGNLRLIAHQLYGDHTRAPELLRLNNLRNPNALQMGDTLSAYAR